MAEEYHDANKSLEKNINKLIRWQKKKGFTSGFFASFGGFIFLPATIPIYLASVLYIQIRMIAAIAHLCGYDIKNPRIRTLVFLCLTGKNALKVLEDSGIDINNKLPVQIINGLSIKGLVKVNKKIIFSLLAQMSELGLVGVGQLIPVASGLICGLINLFSTANIAIVAKEIFLPKE